MVTFLKGMKKITLIVGLVCVVLGLIMIIKTEFVKDVMSAIVGVALILFGLVEIVAVFLKPGKYVAVSRMVPGILALAVGLVALINPGAVASLLWMFVGLAILVDAIYKFQYAFEVKAMKLKTWWVPFLLAFATLVLSIFVIVFSLKDVGYIIKLAGWMLFGSGLLDLGVSAYYGVFTKEISAASAALEGAKAVVPSEEKKEAK